MPQLVIISANRHCSPYPVYPLALSYLKSYLQQAWPALQISLLDLNLADDSQWQQQLAGVNPDYVALSLRNIDDTDSQSQREFISGYRTLVATLRSVTKAPLILGGAGYSLFAKTLLEQLDGDYGIVGEGELTLLQLLQRLEQQRPVNGIEGLLWHNQAAADFVPRKTFIDDPQLQFDADLVAHYWHHSGMLNIQTKRGCPHRCIYCSYPSIDGTTVRQLPIPQIVESLKQAWDQHGIDYVFFTDSVFNLTPDFNEALAKALIKTGLPTKWGAYFAPHRLSSRQLALYQQAGLTHLEFGTEALSDITLASYQKPFRLKQVLRTAQCAAELGLHQAHFLIVGGWGENQESLKQTLENASLLPPTVLFPYFGMRIYPDTGLAMQMTQRHLLAAETDLLTPQYYLSPAFNHAQFQQAIEGHQQRWILPDDDLSVGIAQLRALGKRGPLWEYL
ncbi:lipid biosynthesis B12-binding/radical SAM protein [Ferrimonas senticii]|uniref:lipid biosynthesis B12-binding/radical SAM protein n=1 Tax=Ferrimonas senticii TaxID=394566 RepID=UPI0003FB2BE8|nr:lipid biosynthesis B12-binding/radical SAM protein [Ferrimonas senticii]